MANYLNLNSYSVQFNPLESDNKVIRNVSKEILSLATTENVSALPKPVVLNEAVPNATQINPSINKVNNLPTSINPVSEKVSAYSPSLDTEKANVNSSTVQIPITYNNSRQVAVNQAGFGVNLSAEAQKSINTLNVNAMPYNKPVKTDDVMNGKIFLHEMKVPDELKNIFIVANPIKTQETLSTNLDAKKKSEGFFFNKGNGANQFKQKNSLNVSI